MSDVEDTYEDARENDAVVNGDASDDEAPSAEKAAARKRKKIEPEYPERVSDRGNKGMASSTFLADWLSTHYEPRDESEGEVASKVYDLYFNECVRRQDTALDYHEFVTASLKVFPTVGKESRVPDGKKTKKQMFTGLAMRAESPLFSLTKKKKVNAEGVKEKKSTGINLKEFEGLIVEAVAALDKPGGVGVNKLKRYFGEKHPQFNVEFKAYLLINALERLAGAGKVLHEKGVGACGFYSKVKTEEELAEEKRIKEEKEAAKLTEVKETEESKEVSEEKEGDKESGEDEADKKEEGEKKDEEEKEFEVEKFLNRKKSKGQWHYLVRWAGFDESEDTWEPLENLEGTEEIMKECTAEILKAEKRDQVARKKAWKQRQKASAAKAWEPSKRTIADHLKFVLTACMDEYAATVASIKKYVASHYAAEFDIANKIDRFKKVLEKLSEAGKIEYISGKGLSGNVALTEEGLSALGKSSSGTVDNMVMEAIVAMAEPKGASMNKIKKYYAQHLPSLKTAEQPKRFKKVIESAVEKEVLYQVSGLGLTGSYQLMEPYMPPPVAIRRILKNEVWQDNEYSDVEAKDSEPEIDDSDVDEPVYKPRAATQSGRKTIAAPKKQAPVSVPKPKTGAKRKAAPVKSKYVDDSSEEEEESESEKEEEEEEPPKKKGKQTPAKRGGTAAKGVKKAAPAKKDAPTKKAAPAKKATPAKKAAPAKKGAATPARGGKGGRGGAKAVAAKRAASPSSDEESIASDFEDHPPPIQTKGRGSTKAARGKAKVKTPAKPVNKAAKKTVPVAIGRGGGGRSVRDKAPTYYGTPSPEYDASDDSADEVPPPKRSPAKASPAKQGRGSPAKRGRGAARGGGKGAVKPPPSDSEPESESEEDAPAPPAARGRGRGRGGGAQSPAKKKPARAPTPESESDRSTPPPPAPKAKGRGRGGPGAAKKRR